MKDKYGVFDLGLDESQDYLISPEFPNAREAFRRLESTFNEHHRLPQVYAVRNLSSGNVIGGVLSAEMRNWQGMRGSAANQCSSPRNRRMPMSTLRATFACPAAVGMR